MTPKERKIIFSLVGIMLIILIGAVIIKSSRKAEAVEENNEASLGNQIEAEIGGGTGTGTGTEVGTGTGTGDEVESNQQETSGDNLNYISPSVTKTYKTSIEISNIQFTSEGGNKITADIRNVGNTTFQTEAAKLVLTKTNGNRVETIITIPTIPIGQTVQLTHLLNDDITDVVDFNVEEI